MSRRDSTVAIAPRPGASGHEVETGCGGGIAGGSMIDAGCRDWLTEVVEYARQGTQPSSAVRHHLKLCSHCRARWEDELRLTSELRTLAEAAQLRRPPESRRQQIMAEFDSVQPRRSRPAWKWAAAAAAVLLFGIGVVEMPRLHQVGPLAQDAPVHENAD